MPRDLHYSRLMILRHRSVTATLKLHQCGGATDAQWFVGTQRGLAARVMAGVGPCPGIVLALYLVTGANACTPPARDTGQTDQTTDRTTGPTTGEAPAGAEAGGSDAGSERESTIELPQLDSRGLSDVEQRIVAQIEAEAPSAQAFLQATVDVNSGTMNFPGVRKVGEMFGERLRAIGFKTEWVAQDQVGRAGHLIAELDGGKGKRILLIGHLDTVFEKDSPFQRYEALAGADAGQVKGPGVADMKGGNVILLSALEAMHAQGVLADRRVVVVMTGDEEFTGKPLAVSRARLIAEAKRSDAALGFEGGLEGPNTVVIARRGFTDWTVRTEGKRGHSSRVFSEHFGAGAAYEVARIVNSFYDQLRGERYLTFNVGTMLAGTQVDYDPDATRGTAFGKTNVIAPSAHVAGDLRTLSLEQRERTKVAMRGIVAENLPGTSATIDFRDSYPPMAPSEGNQALAAKLDLVGRDLGLGRVLVVDPSMRGAADVSFVAPHVDCLDGLGMVGGYAHTTKEIADLAAMPTVTKRAAVLVYRLTREDRSKP